MSRHELDSNGRRIRGLKPCYITESLTDNNKLIYNELLQARRDQNGNLVASVFTRRGIVYCRTTKGGDNIRVPDQVTLRRVLGGACFTPPSRLSRVHRRRPARLRWVRLCWGRPLDLAGEAPPGRPLDLAGEAPPGRPETVVTRDAAPPPQQQSR